MTSGIYYSLDERTYRQDPAISQSSLKAIAKSPAHFRAGIEDDDKEYSRALVLGRVVATMILEPDRQTWWTVKPEKISLTTTEGKDWARKECNWSEEKDGKFPKSPKDAFKIKGVTVVDFDDFTAASNIAGALADSKKSEVREIFDGARREVSVFAELETPNGKVAVKSRPDIVCTGDVICDLKTTLDARPTPFFWSARDYGYHIQGASYLMQWNSVCKPSETKNHFLLLAIEKEPPFAHTVYRMDVKPLGAPLSFLEEGRIAYEKLLATYAFCKSMNEWPDYPAGIQSLSLPERHQARIG